jgi:DNA-binding response OmpR family regulator
MPRILIVDDEPEIVRGIEDNLRFEGFQTLSATNAERRAWTWRARRRLI